MIKEPNYFEKLSCGVYMSATAYKVFD